MLWESTGLVIISLFAVVSAQGVNNILMSFDRLMADEDLCVENHIVEVVLTNCTVKCGSTVGFSGSLLILGSIVTDLKVKLKWKSLKVTSFANQQVCLINGRVYIGTYICNRENGDKKLRLGLHSKGPTPDSAFFFKIPNCGLLVCQMNGRVYIGTDKCNRGNGQKVHRLGLHSAGPTPDSAFAFTLPNSGSLENDVADLTGTVTWANSETPVEDYLIDRMKVRFSDD